MTMIKEGPMRRAWHLFPITTIVLLSGLTLPPASVRGDDTVTVTVSVVATEFFGNPLTYHWRATDGHIVDQNSTTTNWTLPDGPGIHFAYVLVSNGKGGYTEGRIAVNTDSNPTTTVVPRDKYTKAPPVKDPTAVSGPVAGTVILDDASVCGTRNPFFGVNVNATVQFADNRGNLLAQAMVLNPYAYGQFAIADNPNGASLVFTCENATLTVPRNLFESPFPFIIRGTAQPEVNFMSASLSGVNIGIFPVPPVVPPGILPSDYLAGRESVAGRESDKSIGPPSRFLAFKGLDSRKGSCEYYKSVGVVEDCDDAGNYQGRTLAFDAWRTPIKIDSPSATSAVFINKTDLNLTRDHHLIWNGGDQLAAYVCNHPGPAPDPNTDPTSLFPSSLAIDAAIDAVLDVNASHPRGRNLIACVAMDRMPIKSVTGQPVTGHEGETFVRFLIFGPNGDLLPSVNLDGNGEKFVPGACVACHGGTNYFKLANGPPYDLPAASQPLFGGFPEDGSGGNDLLSYFLPFDVDNFAFHSTRPPFTKDDQQGQIFLLNSATAQVDHTIAADINQQPAQATAFQQLLLRWYPNGIVFDSTNDVAPPYKKTQKDPNSEFFYKNVVARSCRTCHVAMDQANFELEDPVGLVADLVCGQPLATFAIDPPGSESSYLMPNSRVTFDRFWLSDRPSVVGQPAGSQPAALRDHYFRTFGQQLSCHLP
jgi:hypothetical protein